MKLRLKHETSAESFWISQTRKKRAVPVVTMELLHQNEAKK